MLNKENNNTEFTPKLIDINPNSALPSQNSNQNNSPKLPQPRWIDEVLARDLNFSYQIIIKEKKIDFFEFNLVDLSFKETHGFTINSKKWLDIIHPDDVKSVKKCLTKAIVTNTNYSIAYRIISIFNNKVYYIKDTGYPVQISKELKFNSIIANIRSINLSARQLDESDWKDAIFNGSMDAIFIVNNDSTFADVNCAAVTLTGYSKAELLEMKIADLHDTEDLEAFNTFFNRIFNGENITSEALIRKKDGSKVLTEFNNKPILINENVYMHTVARDISSRMETLKAISENENNLRLFFENAAIGMSIASLSGNFIQVNKSMSEMLGYSQNELIGKHISEITYFEDCEQDKIDIQLLIDKKVNKIQKEKRYVHKNGKILWGYLNLSIIYDNENNPLHMIGQVQNIDDRKKAERDLLRSESLLKTTFDSLEGKITVHDKNLNILYSNWKKADNPTSSNSCYAYYFGKNKVCENCVTIKVLKSGIPQREEMFVDIDNTVHEINAYPVFNESGEVFRVVEHITDLTRKRVAEKELEELNDKISATLSVVPDILFEIDETFIIHNFKAPSSQVVFDATIGKNTEDILPHEALQKIKLSIFDAVQNGSSVGHCFWHSINSKKMWFELFVALKSIVDNKKIFTVIARDITPRRNAEEELIKSEMRFAEFMNHIPNAIFIKDEELKYVYVNKYYREKFGDDEWVGKNAFDIFDGETAQTITINDQKTLDTGFCASEEAINDKFGVERIFQTTKFLISSQDYKKYIGGFAVDITENKFAEDAFKEIMDRLDFATKFAGVGVWDWDIQNDIVVWDEVVYELFGTTEDNSFGAEQTFIDGVLEEDLPIVKRNIKKAIAQQDKFDCEFRVKWSDNSIKYIKSVARIMNDHLGEPERMIGVNWDITDQKLNEQQIFNLNKELELKVLQRTSQLQEALSDLKKLNIELANSKEVIVQESYRIVEVNKKLLQSEKELIEANKTKDKFFSFIANDLKNPLQVLLTSSNLLDLHIANKNLTKMKEQNDRINQTTEFLIELFQNILTLGGSQIGEYKYLPSFFSINDLISSILKNFNNALNKEKISVDFTKLEKDIVYADKDMISDIIRNILSLTVKFAKKNGVISIGTKRENDKIYCIFKDNCMGQTHPDFEHFNNLNSNIGFLTPDHQNTNLGLIICREFATINGGSFEIETDTATGCKVSFSLPAKLNKF